MKFIGFDKKEYTLTFKNKQRSNCSKLHERAREVIREVFKNDNIYEEVTLPGSSINRQPLTADFFIPCYRIMVEVQGEQHYKFNNFHFKNKKAFLLAQARDRKKKEWCEINNITLIELGYNNESEWREKFTGS